MIASLSRSFGVFASAWKLCRSVSESPRLNRSSPKADFAYKPNCRVNIQTHTPFRLMASSSVGQTPPVVVAINDSVSLSDLSAKLFLTKAPRGAYTTARSFDQTCIFELDLHLERLANTLALMDAKEPLPLTKKDVSDVVLPKLKSSMRYFIDRAPPKTEMRITVVITNPQVAKESWAVSPIKDTSKEDINVLVHISHLPPPPSAPVKVIVRGSPRKNAAAKDSAWVVDRQSLEAQMPADVNETVLCEDGSIFEGLTSNFFALSEGKLYTAPEGTVLAGTVRAVAIDVCKKEGIDVVLEAPNISSIRDWTGCFISSTSRLMTPVNELSLPEIEASPVYRFETTGPNADPTVSLISQRVRDLLKGLFPLIYLLKIKSESNRNHLQLLRK